MPSLFLTATLLRATSPPRARLRPVAKLSDLKKENKNGKEKAMMV
jgi:hypothetical protein